MTSWFVTFADAATPERSIASLKASAASHESLTGSIAPFVKFLPPGAYDEAYFLIAESRSLVTENCSYGEIDGVGPTLPSNAGVFLIACNVYEKFVVISSGLKFWRVQS